jgi:hypothetical protein
VRSTGVSFLYPSHFIFLKNPLAHLESSLQFFLPGLIEMEKTIVILGGGHGGVHLSHYLLSATNLVPDLKVILVSPTEEFFVCSSSHVITSRLFLT